MIKHFLQVTALAAALAATPVMAHPEAGAMGSASPQLQLDAQARSLVDNDLMTVTLNVEAEGPSVQELSQRVLATLQAVAARAKAQPGIDVRIGTVSTQPVWGPKGRTGQWQVTGGVTLSSTQVAALGLLASELTARAQVSSVGFSLSRARSDEVEARLMAEAVTAFQRKAQVMANALGFKGYAIKTVNLSQAGTAPPPRALMALRGASPAADSAVVPIPAEGGQTEVVLTVSGAVELR